MGGNILERNDFGDGLERTTSERVRRKRVAVKYARVVTSTPTSYRILRFSRLGLSEFQNQCREHVRYKRNKPDCDMRRPDPCRTCAISVPIARDSPVGALLLAGTRTQEAAHSVLLCRMCIACVSRPSYHGHTHISYSVTHH